MKRVLLILSHAIEEHDQVKLLTGLGYDVFSLGGYIDPAHPHVDLRPPVDAPAHPDLKAVVDALGTDDNIGAAAQCIPGEVLEWLGRDGIIIAHHYLEARIYPQWAHLASWRKSGGRVIRRTVGQSVENNEREAAPFVRDGMETVRYSPYESRIPGYTGQDALIRFWADPVAYSGWTGAGGYVANVTQELWRRGVWCNADFARDATLRLPALFAGPGSGDGPVPGLGPLAYDDMRAYLREAGAYIYTGTQPASYTLGLLEAMMTGVPIVSVGRELMTIFPCGRDLFEAADWTWGTHRDPANARAELAHILSNSRYARVVSGSMRARALELFDPGKIGAQWREYLG
jgi:hypothetical protein